MASTEENNLPAPVSAEGGGLEVANASEEEARRSLAQIAVVDPAIRKRIFSSLLRSISVGGS